MIIIGIAIGLLIGYLLFRTRNNAPQPPAIDYTALRDQAAHEIELWQDTYTDETQKQIVRDTADRLRRGVLPPQTSGPTVYTQTAAGTPTHQALDAAPVVSVASNLSLPTANVPAVPRNPHDDMVSLLAYLGAFILVAGITVFSVQAEGIARFLWLFFMSALFYAGGMSLRNIASLKNVGNTFLGIGLIAAPFAMLSVGEFSGLTQPAVWFLSSVVTTLLYGFTASIISSKLLQYVFLASVFVAGQTAMANLTTEFAWLMLTLSTTGLLIAVVQRVIGLRADVTDQTAAQVTRLAVLAGAGLSVVSLMADVSAWPVVVATQLVSALYFAYYGLYESAHSAERQRAWSVAQLLAIVAVVVLAGASQIDIKTASLALASVGLLYSVALLAIDRTYQQYNLQILRQFHVGVVTMAIPLALFTTLFVSDFESERVLLLALSITQFFILQFVHKFRDASWGWSLGLWLMPAVVINQLFTTADIAWYTWAYAVLSVVFVSLWLYDRRTTITNGAYLGFYIVSSISLIVSAMAWNTWAVAAVLFGLALSVAIVAWRISTLGLASLALSLLLVAVAVSVEAGSIDGALTFGALFVAATAAYMLARMIPLYLGDQHEPLSVELRITSGGFILGSSLLNASNGSTLIALLAFYVFSVVLMTETWRFGQNARQLASASLLIAVWWTLAYNGVENWLVFSYVAALYVAVLAIWQRFYTGSSDQQYRNLVLVSGLLAGIPIAFAAFVDKETYALAAIIQNVILVLIGLNDELKVCRWIGFWTVVVLVSLQLLSYGFLFLWFIGAILIGLAIFFALRGSSRT